MKAPPIRTTVCSVSVQITAVRPPKTQDKKQLLDHFKMEKGKGLSASIKTLFTWTNMNSFMLESNVIYQI